MANIISEAKKKKNKIKTTYTTGSIGLNIEHFNKLMGTDFDDDKKNEGEEAADKANSEISGGENNGADGSTTSTGESTGSSDGESTGEGGSGMTESLLHEDKILIGKLKEYVDLPPHIHILRRYVIEDIVHQLEPEEEFEVGYVTPVYFYKELWDKFRLIKCTQMYGFTGEDYSFTAQKSSTKDQRVDTAKRQIAKGMHTSVRYKDTNKTVIQKGVASMPADDRILSAKAGGSTELNTLLFYPSPNRAPKVTYYLDLLDGNGFFQVDANTLDETIFEYLYKISDSSDSETRIEGAHWSVDTLHKKIETTIATDAATRDGVTMGFANISNLKPKVRALYTNQIYYLASSKTTIGLSESLTKLTEAKRYVKRYFVRPQNIYCSNKAEILKTLIDLGEANCSVYTLKNLDDNKDIHKLTTKDIIYYYDNGILYDKNKVKVMDYDLYIKHEEERKKIDVDEVSDKTFEDEYEDRMTDATVTEDLDNPFKLDFESRNAFGESVERGGVCCICGEEYEGYGNNPEPYAHDGKCCDACNLKFVVPARLELVDKED